MEQLTNNRIFILIFCFIIPFTKDSVGQVKSNARFMLPGKIISKPQTIKIGDFYFSQEIILVETAKKDTIGIIYDTNILAEKVTKFSFLIDSTFIFGATEMPSKNQIDNWKLYFISAVYPLRRAIWEELTAYYNKYKLK